NPTIFEKAIKGSGAYDATIRAQAPGTSAEEVFEALAVEDLKRAAALFLPVFEATGGKDGWVSLEVSPLLARDAQSTLAEAKRLHARVGMPNLFVKIPGTAESLPAIEEAIFAGIPVNVTMLFSVEQYLAAAEAWARGIERRRAAGLSTDVASVASLFVSRWDTAVAGKVPPELQNGLGIAVARSALAGYRRLCASPRWQHFSTAQRLLFASTGTKDPAASPVLYVHTLAAAGTVNTLPEATLQALASAEEPGGECPDDGVEATATLAAFAAAGIDAGELAARLQQQGADAFVASWSELMAVIAARRAAMASS
ncbi:MAG: transaldolase family protein, partial [Gammaproteobacteria bacterium]